MKLLIILNLLLIGLFANANNANATSENPTISPELNNIVMENNIEGMDLNDGKKWQMDKHTRESFNEMAEYFLSKDIGLLSQDQLKEQGNILQSYLDNLIQGCTMQGKEHDQLHTFLMLYMPEVEALSKTGNKENALKAQYYLKNYSNYFE